MELYGVDKVSKVCGYTSIGGINVKVMVLTSGGLDSATCLGFATEKYGKENVVALSVYYGQKHDKEIQAAKAITDYYEIELLHIDLEPIFKNSDCSLLKHSAIKIPQKAYFEQIKEQKNKPVSTYVPFRNGLFLACATSIAISKNCGVIFYGAHADDAAGNAYPDCSKDFHNAINKAVITGSGGQVRLEAP